MRLLVAYDGSEHSAFALDEAARLAAEGGTEVVVLSVVPPSARGSKAGGHVGLAPHVDADVGQARAYFDKRGIDATLKIAHGDPAHEITKEAREGGYDRIVVGTRELGPIARHLLGSVSRKVAEDAPARSPSPARAASRSSTRRRRKPPSVRRRASEAAGRVGMPPALAARRRRLAGYVVHPTP